MARILTSFNELKGQADVIVVEGVGGFMVPLNEKEDTATLAQHLALPVILVVGMRLGCLSHAMLTLRVIESYQLECVGWIANVLDAEMPALQQNIDTLIDRLVAPLLGVIPFQAQPDVAVAASCLRLELLIQQEEIHE